MRWPWQRKEEAPVPVELPGAAGGGLPAAPREAAGPAPSPAGWAFLPPLQRTLGELGTTTAPHRFTERLPTRTDPSFTGAMSHLISADAPAGVIDLDRLDEGPAPARPGPAERSVEMTLLPPPAPPGAGVSRPVQRLTPAPPGSLTEVPEGDFGVLRLPVVPEPRITAPDPAADQPAQPTAGPVAELTPESPDAVPAEPSAAPEGTGSAPPDARACRGVPGGVPDGVASSGPTAGAADGTGPAVPPPPLQRSVRDRSGSAPSSASGRDSGRDTGSTFDGAATTVPLPRPGTPVQRTAGTAGAGAASSPVPSSVPATPPRLGLGRPWPVRDPAPARPEEPAVQRTDEAPGLPSSVAAAASAATTSSTPAPPATGASATPAPPATGASATPAPPVDRTAAATEMSAPADPPASPAAVPGEGPARTSPGPPPAGIQGQPVVSRSPVDGPPVHAPVHAPVENLEDEGAVTGRSTPASLYRGRAGSGPAPFADPPLFAGRQAPDTRRPDILPVALRSVTSSPVEEPAPRAATATGDPAASQTGPGPTPAPPDVHRPMEAPTGQRSAQEDVPDVQRSAEGTRSADVHGAAPEATTAPDPGSGAALPETAPLSSAVRSPSAADPPARSLGLRPSLSLPVVSRSAGGNQAFGSARTTGATARTPAASAAPPTTPDGSGNAPVSPPVPGPRAVPVGGPAVSRYATTDLRPGPGPAWRAAPGARTDGGPAAGGEQTGEPPAPPSVARAAAVLRGGNGSPPAPSRLLQAPIGSLQRSFAGPHGSQRRPGLRGTPLGPHPAAATGVVALADAPEPAPGTSHGAAHPIDGAGGEPVAMLLALPGRQFPDTGASVSSRSAVQRQEAPGGAVPAPEAAPSGGPEFLQRVGEEPAAAPGPSAGPAGPPAAPSSSATPDAAAAPGEVGMSQEQVDALAKRLVGPIVRRIKADMLLDRERRGLRIDVG